MTEYLTLKPSNCKNCYKCIRHCPVKSISFSDNTAGIVHSECILCGRCFVECPQNAKHVRSDVGRARALLESGRPVWASVAPSFVANWNSTGIEALERALRALGFAGAEETALGATAVKKKYEQMVREKEQSIIISSCCHTVNMLIQKHYPEALPYIARVKSPMQAHCESLKQRYEDAATVFIGPCVSKKAEAEDYPGLVDCVLTFEELGEWLEEEGVTVEAVPAANPEDTGRARLFPVTGGILRTMHREKGTYGYIAVDGIDNCIAAIEDIKSGRLDHCFIEMSACAGSCIGGPVMAGHHYAPVIDKLAVDRYAGHEDFDVEPFDDPGMDKDIPFIGIHRQLPGKAAIEEVLRKMGKTSPEQELNCSSCGYETCREKAVAVLQGKAELTMCLPYLMEKAESFSDHIIKNTPNGIVVLNEALEVQQVNKAACQMMNIKQERDIVGDQVVRILDPGTFMEVLASGRNIYDQRVYLAEYQRYVEQTVLLDKSYHIIIVLMRDITAEYEQRQRREETSRTAVEITDKVIEKQMRAVQEIASLLGETTAETKVALTNLKETLRDDD